MRCTDGEGVVSIWSLRGCVRPRASASLGSCRVCTFETLGKGPSSPQTASRLQTRTGRAFAYLRVSLRAQEESGREASCPLSPSRAETSVSVSLPPALGAVPRAPCHARPHRGRGGCVPVTCHGPHQRAAHSGWGKADRGPGQQLQACRLRSGGQARAGVRRRKEGPVPPGWGRRASEACPGSRSSGLMVLPGRRPLGPPAQRNVSPAGQSRRRPDSPQPGRRGRWRASGLGSWCPALPPTARHRARSPA